MPLRRVYIPKSNGKKRPLGIPCMRCRAMQALVEARSGPCGGDAWRIRIPMDSGPNARLLTPSNSASSRLAKHRSPEWILEGDIRGCFDNFSHPWLLQHIPMDKQILRRWLQAGYIDEGTSVRDVRREPRKGGLSRP